MHAIKDEFEAYGWRRMQAALRHQGWLVNHQIKRLMREQGLNPPLRRQLRLPRPTATTTTRSSPTGRAEAGHHRRPEPALGG